MKRLLAVALTAAFFAGVAVASLAQRGAQRPLVLRGAASSSPLLGLAYGRLDVWLTRLDPKTLKVLPGRKLALGRFWSGWSLSPDRAQLAFGNQPSSSNDSPAAIRFVDAGSLRTVSEVPLGVEGYVAVTHWVQADRLLALVRSQKGDSVVVVDPVAQRVLARQALAGSVRAIARANGA